MNKAPDHFDSTCLVSERPYHGSKTQLRWTRCICSDLLYTGLRETTSNIQVLVAAADRLSFSASNTIGRCFKLRREHSDYMRCWRNWKTSETSFLLWRSRPQLTEPAIFPVIMGARSYLDRMRAPCGCIRGNSRRAVERWPVETLGGFS
jgi:hypothetical protein